MNKPSLSVVMPVYNVARYLPQCLDSLIAQRKQPDEIIAVDDGSTDECPRILAEYAAKMSNLRVIRQKNGGLSAARNTGMAAATGDYLAFLDSDDFADPDLYSRLMAAVADETFDMVLCNGRYHHEGRKADQLIYQDGVDEQEQSGRSWLLGRLRAGRLMHMVWLHLYRREFLLAQQASFVPNLIHEDVVWTTERLRSAERVKYLSEALISYRIPVRHFTPEQNRVRVEKLIDSSIYNARCLMAIAREEAGVGNATLSRLLGWQLVDGAFSIFHKIEQLPDRERRRARLTEQRESGLMGALWGHAANWTQRRRLARYWLKSHI